MWCRAELTKLLILDFSLAHYYVIPLLSKYISHALFSNILNIEWVDKIMETLRN
jgi:hypothetical protein